MKCMVRQTENTADKRNILTKNNKPAVSIVYRNVIGFIAVICYMHGPYTVHCTNPKLPLLCLSQQAFSDFYIIYFSRSCGLFC